MGVTRSWGVGVALDVAVSSVCKRKLAAVARDWKGESREWYFIF